MLHWALFFFVVSIIAGFRGQAQVAGICAFLSVLVLGMFIGLFMLSLIMTLLTRRFSGLAKGR